MIKPAIAGWKYWVWRGRALSFPRSQATNLEKMKDAKPPTTPKTVYARSSSVLISETVGMRNSGCDPRKKRATTTLDTAERTMDPRMAALQRPITSSMTNRTAEIGALKAAASPAAAPTGAMRRTFSRERRRRRPSAEAMVAPIWRDGSSGPRECPEPIASAEQMNLPTAVRNGMYPL